MLAYNTDMNGAGTGGFPRPGGAATDGAAAMEEVGRKWEYTPEEAAREEGRFEPMETYI